MDFTAEISKAFSLSPFDVLQQDKDYVVMLINYYIEKSEITPQAEIQTQPNNNMKTNSQTRIRVNDETATGGWF